MQKDAVIPKYPPATNLEPETGPYVDYHPLKQGTFGVPCYFGGGYSPLSPTLVLLPPS